MFPTFFVSAQTCLPSEDQQRCQSRLRQEQKKLEAEVEKLKGDIQKEGTTQKTLSGEISKLNTEIKKTSVQISKKNSLISNIRKEINKKETNLKNLNEKLKREKESLEKILRKRYKLGDASLFEVLLSAQKISDFYTDAPAFSYVQSSLSDSFNYIEDLKQEIYGEKKSLERKKDQEDNAKYSLTLEKGKIEVQKKDRNQALSISKSKEAGLTELKRLREQEIQKIRSALIRFQGSGVTSRSISFGEAYDYAKLTEGKTGVRAAFIMAIMQQETNFGNNVGGCYLQKKPLPAKNGVYAYDGIYIKSKKPSRKNMIPSHYDAFVRITSALGRDWKKTPISCALVRSNGSLYGYGGAMGYTQFIPKTWESVAPRVRKYLGLAAANPWNPRDAVMATGIFLMDKGAANKKYTTERNAACRYYGACSTYADSVMRKATTIQQQINTLERN